ncbi:hypothetical protein J2S54_002337 [Streptomyces sp. DSM 42143]|nr:hypothetical protein [Streptomyces sp. DSM 42143]
MRRGAVRSDSAPAVRPSERQNLFFGVIPSDSPERPR